MLNLLLVSNGLITEPTNAAFWTYSSTMNFLIHAPCLAKSEFVGAFAAAEASAPLNLMSFLP